MVFQHKMASFQENLKYKTFPIAFSNCKYGFEPFKINEYLIGL